MKFTTSNAVALVAASSAVLVAAQSAQDLPSCSVPCFIKYVPTTGCSLTDYTCQCTTAHQAAIKSQIAMCVESMCTAQSDQLKTLSVTNAICAKYGSSSSGSMSMMSGSSMSSMSSMMSGASSSNILSATSLVGSGGMGGGAAPTTFTSAGGSIPTSGTSSASLAFTPTGPPSDHFTGAAIREAGVEVRRVGWGMLVAGLVGGLV